MGWRSSEVPGSGSVQTSGFDVKPRADGGGCGVKTDTDLGKRIRSLVRLRAPLGRQSSVGLTSGAKNKRRQTVLSAPAGGRGEAQPS